MLRAAARRDLPEGCADALRLRSARLVSIRDNSLIWRCQSAEGELAVKRCINSQNGTADPESARLEFTSLRRIRDAAGAAAPGRLVPKPIALMDDIGVLAMSWEPGVPMTKVITGMAADRRVGASSGAAAGEWLRQFHDLHRLAPRPGDFRNRLLAVQAEPVAPGATLDHLHKRLIGLLDMHCAAAEAVDLPASWVYGDFKSDNLLVAGGTAIAIDAQIQYENTVVHNIAPFLVHLALLRWTARGWRNQRVLAATEEAFLSAYCPADAASWRLPIWWLVTEMLLQRSIACSRRAGVGPRLHGWLIRRALADAGRRLNRYGER